MTVALHTPQLLRSCAEQRITLVVGDPHPLLRRGLVTLLENEPDFALAGEADTTSAAQELINRAMPEVALLDASLLLQAGRAQRPGMLDGDVLTGAGAPFWPPACRVIVLSESPEQDIMRLLIAGVRGVVRKTEPTPLLLKCIRKVHEGELWIPRPILADVVTLVAASNDPQRLSVAQTFGLTARELEILQLIASGDTNKGIARQLSVCEDTVKHHLTKVFDKTGASNRTELVMFAFHHGLIRPD